MNRSRWGRGAVWLSLLAAGCGGSDLLLPNDGEPARITAVETGNLSGIVGQPLGDSLVVQVTDPGGRPVAGVEIEFLLPTGAAATPGTKLLSGDDGQAAIFYTLGTISGQQTVDARASAISGPAAVAQFIISAAPDAPEALVPLTGNGQRAQVSTVLPESLAVRVVDRFGNGVPGVEVTWDASGGGDVSPASSVTDANGRAATARTLGDRPGAYSAAARAEGLEGSPVSFSATAVAPPRPELVLVSQPSPTAAAGVPLQQQPVIQLQDPFGAPLNQGDVVVTVQIANGPGSVGGTTTARSNGSGLVTFTDLELRGQPGSRSLIFAADGFTPVTSADIEVGPGPPAAGESSVSAANGTAGAATAITIRLRDEFGNKITGAGEDLSIRITGANPESGIAVTDDGNGSYSASYVPVRTGRDEISLVYRGETLGGPIETLVVPGAPDPTTSTAVVTRRGVLLVQVGVVVTVRDSQGNPVGRGGDLVELRPNGGLTRQAVDNGDGTYSDRFLIVATEVSVEISLNGVPLAGSPFIAQ